MGKLETREENYNKETALHCLAEQNLLAIKKNFASTCNENTARKDLYFSRAVGVYHYVEMFD